MKYINHKITGLILAVGIFSMGCDSYLEEENRSSITIETAASDPETLDQLVATVYERARENTTRYVSDMYYVLEDMGTDIATRRTPIQGVDEINDYVNMNSFTWATGVYWNNQYSIIAAANTVIDNAPNIEDLTDDERATSVGQAKFFRAWSYFYLVENYGSVPLVLNQVTSSDSEYIRASEQEVYTQIVQDLQEAISSVDSNPNSYGLVSKDAARHLLSKVLLTRGYKDFASGSDFTEAATLAETVIANNPLVSSFSDLISIDNQRNSEVIFSYLFGSNSVSRGWGNSKHMMYKFRFYDYPGLERTVQALDAVPTPFYYSLFNDENDEREEATFTRELYATEDYVGKNGENVLAGELAIFFPKMAWTQAEIDAVPYAVINPDTYFINDGVTTVHTPMFTKFDDPSVPFTQPDQPSLGERDMVMMRSGEAYLIAAEAHLNSNASDLAAVYLTTLRSRAGITTAVSAGEVTLDFILDERARELAGEVNRWMDLKRTGKLIERTLMYNPHAAMNDALEQKHLLRPIPQVEIDVTNGAIEQNPGY